MKIINCYHDYIGLIMIFNIIIEFLLNIDDLIYIIIILIRNIVIIIYK